MNCLELQEKESLSLILSSERKYIKPTLTTVHDLKLRSRNEEPRTR